MVTPLKINNVQPQRQNNINFRGKTEAKFDAGLDLIPEGQSIVYFSDTHSNISCFPKLAGFINMVQARLKREDIIKLCSGDFLFGKDSRNEGVITKVLNRLNLNSIIPGNHEFDMPLNKVKEILKNLTMPILGANIKNLFPDIAIKGNHQFKANSYNYGTVGITLEPEDKEGKHVDRDIAETIETVQKEVDSLTRQGINRILLTSHLGSEKDKQIAQQTSGIDVIISSHDHKNSNGVEEGKNVFRSRTNEPVVILQASENCNSIGYARVAFDAKGILTKVFNKVISASSKDIPEDKKTLDILSGSLSLKPMGFLLNEGSIKNINTNENALANWILDTIKTELKVPQAVIFDSRMIRAGLNAGKIREYNIDEMLPLRRDRESECFKTLEINGKQLKELVNMLTNVADQTKPNRIAQIAGLKYSVNTSNQVEDIQIEVKKGQFASIKETEYYAIALPKCIIDRKNLEQLGLTKARVIAEHNKTAQETLKDYLTSARHLIRLKTDKRINVKAARPEELSMPNFIDLAQ